jgi:16S rRNA (uracil1498-N3)-methyltransferase
MIGPEGGFSDEEIKEALAHNIQPITLGKRILRTETAAICAMSILMITLESEA